MTRAVPDGGLLRTAILPVAALFVAAAVLVATDTQGAERVSAPQILAATGVEGGLIVHLGCGDGKVSVDGIAGGSLPYADNLMDFLVGADLGQVSMAEVTRVLAPNGVAYVNNGGKWTKTVKPRPAESCMRP